MMATEHDVKEAVRCILRDKEHFDTSLNYAVNYCRAALGMSGDELKVQCLYILGNIQHWRHPDAKEVRLILKQFTKERR